MPKKWRETDYPDMGTPDLSLWGDSLWGLVVFTRKLQKQILWTILLFTFNLLPHPPWGWARECSWLIPLGLASWEADQNVEVWMDRASLRKGSGGCPAQHTDQHTYNSCEHFVLGVHFCVLPKNARSVPTGFLRDFMTLQCSIGNNTWKLCPCHHISNFPKKHTPSKPL